jgi:hypothetical protein
MGKRSNKKRRKLDFYPTPFKAVQPLIPHLNGVRRFAEPCCGDGRLVRHLESFGLVCVYAGDIAGGQDALMDKLTACCPHALKFGLTAAPVDACGVAMCEYFVLAGVASYQSVSEHDHCLKKSHAVAASSRCPIYQDYAL